MTPRSLLIGGLLSFAVVAGSSREGSLQAQAPATPEPAAEQALVDKYCVTCHNARTLSGNLSLAGLDASKPGDHPEVFEKVVRKVRAGLMPPAGMPRPERATLDGFAAGLETKLDRAAALSPNPGSHLLHRMNRTEYANAIRDLLHLDIDTTTLLPADDSSEGFDNLADALRVSPALVERYTSAAVKVSRLAVGNLLLTASTATYRVPGDLTQSNHLDGLPLGTRGGTLIEHTFPLDAEYSFRIRVRGAAIGLAAANLQGEEIEVSLDGERIKLVPATATIDVKLPMKAGPHALGVTFVRKPPPGADDVWQIFAANSGVQSVAITGPLAPTALGDTPSRRRIFVCHPQSPADERRPMREAHPLDGRAPRVPSAGHGCRHPDAHRVLRDRPESRWVRCGHRTGSRACARRSAVRVPPRARAGEHRRRQAVSSLRSRARVAALVLPLEQHSGRCAAGRGGQGHAARACCARAADPSHAGRSQGAERW